MQGARVRALVREDPTRRGATKPVHDNYWACALEPASHSYWAHMPGTHAPPMLRNKRSHCNGKPAHHNEEQARSLQLKKARVQQWRPNAAKNK